MSKLIQKGFEEFMEAGYEDLPKDSSQYKDCRWVFYAGCLWGLNTLRDSKGDVVAIEAIINELKDFYSEVKLTAEFVKKMEDNK